VENGFIHPLSEGIVLPRIGESIKDALTRGKQDNDQHGEVGFIGAGDERVVGVHDERRDPHHKQDEEVFPCLITTLLLHL